MYFLLEKVKGIESCPTFCNSMDCSLPGASVHGILQTRILEWVASAVCRASSQPRDWTRVSCIAVEFLTNWATREARTFYLCFDCFIKYEVNSNCDGYIFIISLRFCLTILVLLEQKFLEYFVCILRCICHCQSSFKFCSFLSPFKKFSNHQWLLPLKQVSVW